MAKKQYKQLGCLDVDPTAGCAFEVRAETEAEVLRLAADHGKTVHRLSELSPDQAVKIRAAIKTVSVNV